MTEFDQPPEALKQAAAIIRTSVCELVEDRLAGIFSVCPSTAMDVYRESDVFIRMGTALEYEPRDDGSQEASMLIINPAGDIDSGLIQRRRDGHGTLFWDFTGATLQPASDLEVAEYGSLLVAELFRKVAETTLYEVDNPKQLEAIIDFLDSKFDTVTAMETATETALKIHYGEEYARPARSADDIREIGSLSPALAKLASYEFGKNESLERQELTTDEIFSASSLRAAFEMYKKHGAILETIQSLAEAGQPDQVQSSLKELITTATNAGIFPATVDLNQIDGQPFTWGGSVESVSSLVQNSLSGHTWIIFKDGTVKAKSPHPVQDPDSPEAYAVWPSILASNALKIADNFVRQIVHERFPGLASKQLGDRP